MGHKKKEDHKFQQQQVIEDLKRMEEKDREKWMQMSRSV